MILSDRNFWVFVTYCQFFISPFFFLSFFLSFFPNIKCFNRDLLGKLMHNKDHRVNMGAPWYSGYHLCLVLRKSMVQIMVHLILDDCKKEGSIGLIGKEKNKLKRRRGGNWTHYSHYGIGKSVGTSFE